MPRFPRPIPLASGQTVDLPASAARHVQVLRMQPGMRLASNSTVRVVSSRPPCFAWAAA